MSSTAASSSSSSVDATAATVSSTEEDALFAKFMASLEEVPIQSLGSESVPSVHSADDHAPPQKRQCAVEDSEEDPLDAYMKNLEKSSTSADDSSFTKKKLSQFEEEDADDDDEDDSLSSSLHSQDDNMDFGTESEDNNNMSRGRKIVQPIPPFDHSSMSYSPFPKNFYQIHADFARLSNMEQQQMRDDEGIRVHKIECKRKQRNTAIDKPEESMEEIEGDHDDKEEFELQLPPMGYQWQHFHFPSLLNTLLSSHGFSRPTPIQSQCIPILSAGFNLLLHSTTGSGKTLAYLLPAFFHIFHARKSSPKAAEPIVLVLVPTRELAQQVLEDMQKFCKHLQLSAAAVFGGRDKHTQFLTMRRGVDALVGTPGRLCDMIRLKATNLQRVRYVVLDECDKMLDMGFERQVKALLQHVRGDAQMVLCSATSDRRTKRFVKELFYSPAVNVQMGGGATGGRNDDNEVLEEDFFNENIQQIIRVFKTEEDKLEWLVSTLHPLLPDNRGAAPSSSVISAPLLIFVNTRATCESLHTTLRSRLPPSFSSSSSFLHGALSQDSRSSIVESFRSGRVVFLISTAVAARGLHVEGLATVVNFESAKDVEEHCHRIGRTGRAGKKGVAVSLLIEDTDEKFAVRLAEAMMNGPEKYEDHAGKSSAVPRELLQLAWKSPAFQGKWGKRERDKKKRKQQESKIDEEGKQHTPASVLSDAADTTQQSLRPNSSKSFHAVPPPRYFHQQKPPPPPLTAYGLTPSLVQHFTPSSTAIPNSSANHTPTIIPAVFIQTPIGAPIATPVLQTMLPSSSSDRTAAALPDFAPPAKRSRWDVRS